MLPNKQLCRSQLASIILAQRLRECQGFIDKVGEIRFTKVKQRQLNKFNNLLNKKEGNITRANFSNSPNLASQAGRQAGTHLHPWEGSILVAQAGAHLPMGKEAIYLRQAVRQLLPSQVLTFPLGKEATQQHRQVLTFPLGKEAVYLRQAVRQLLPSQALTFPPGKKAV